MKKQRIICGMMSALLFFSSPLTVFAETTNSLSKVEEEISNLSQAQVTVQSEINILNADMVDLIIQIESIKGDISLVEFNIEKTQEQIGQISSQIENTKQNLVIAQEQEQEQYDAMKSRIQYIYENGGGDWGIILLTESEDFASFLNKVDFTQSLYEYDKEQLDAYVETVNEVKNLQTQLEEQEKKLNETNDNLVIEKTSLESQQIDLFTQQNELQNQIDNKQSLYENFAEQIESAQQQAAEIMRLIQKQEELIAEHDQAITDAKEEISQSSVIESSNSDDAKTAISHEDVVNTMYEEVKTEVYSSSGYDIVEYASQWIGNPYVWGGNSLTNGIDCSHFVWQVLKNTGHYNGGYYTSSGWRSLGSSVSSLSEAKAGDVICYSGHVAIYDGHGGIVEAKGEAWGITHDRTADHATILAIRRFS